uniref:Uncharacterized protein n=1 Tax=Amblyomma triste TaxID=251400 RepID=A0A023GBG6_AMBTT
MNAIDTIRDLGDPDHICALEDHILVKLEKPWKPVSEHGDGLPEGLNLHSNGLHITTTSASFVKNADFLADLRVTAALFAGCDSFNSCWPLGAAARGVLADVRTLVIVHNRDYVRDLICYFPSVEVLVLHHDLKLQMPEEEWGDIPGATPQLKRLIGSAPALGTHNLFLSAATICGLLGDCPYLCELQTSMHEILNPSNPLIGMLLASRPSLLTTWKLVLGADVERLDGTTGVVWDITPGHMVQANMFFHSLRKLEVTTTHSQTIAAIGIFEQLTDVSLMFIAQGTLCAFRGLLEDTLKRLKLKHLSLKFIKGISLLAVAQNWPQLQSLSLAECSVDDDLDEIPPGSFAGLVKLRVGSDISIRTLEMVLGATRRLVTLRLDGDLLCTSFVIRCSLGSLPRLERLTLGTKQSLPALVLTGNDVRYLIKALPALRYVATDSYDLRLFFENYMPKVTLDWCQCTTCAAEFPRIDEAQKDFWTKAVAPLKRPR